MLVLLLLFACARGPAASDTSAASATSATSATTDSTAAIEPHDSSPETVEPSSLTIHGTPTAMVHSWVVTVEATEPLPAELHCVSPEEPDEDFHYESDEASTLHRFTVDGLLAETAYTCTANAGDLEALLELVTSPLPEHLPQLVPSGTPGEALAHGYLVFNTWRFDVAHGQQIVVTDPEGRIRWSTAAEDSSQVDVDVTFLGEEGFLAAGGITLPPTRFALDGTIAWQSGPTEPLGWHHDVRPAGPDELVALTHRDNEHDGVTFLGFGLEVRRAWSDEILWTWDSQQAVDAGTLPPAADEGADAYHANAVSWVPDDPDGPAFWVNLKFADQIVRVDRSTGEITWRLGVGGDFALDDPHGVGWFYGQHDPELTGLDRLVVFDNGVGRPGPEHSRVVGYELDLAARVVRPRWTWTEPDWYEPLFGDADTLADGHVLVDKGRCKSCSSPLGGDDRVWSLIELDPETRQVVYRLDAATPDVSSYRADLVDGCELFANARYCRP